MKLTIYEFNKIVIYEIMILISFLSTTGCTIYDNPADTLPATLAIMGGSGMAYVGKDQSPELQMAWTAAGIGAGWMAGQFVAEGFASAKAKEFRTGYDLGRSNSTKEVFWYMQKLHNYDEGSEQSKVYELPIQYNEIDGVKREPSHVYFPITE